MSRNIAIAPDEFYHVYNRGVDKRNIFISPNDYERFISLLHLCNSNQRADLKLQGSTLYDFLKIEVEERLVDIGAYCLMPNHFHLLIREHVDGGVSKFMQKITTGYTMYFNKKNDRSGVLFQGTFKAQHADTDEYLKYLFSYIHLNPVKLIEPKWREQGLQDEEKTKKFLNSYRFSSYPDYTSAIKRPECILLKAEAFPDYFVTPRDLERHMNDWLEFSPDLQGRTL